MVIDKLQIPFNFNSKKTNEKTTKGGKKLPPLKYELKKVLRNKDIFQKMCHFLNMRIFLKNFNSYRKILSLKQEIPYIKLNKLKFAILGNEAKAASSAVSCFANSDDA